MSTGALTKNNPMFDRVPRIVNIIKCRVCYQSEAYSKKTIEVGVCVDRA